MTKILEQKWKDAEGSVIHVAVEDVDVVSVPDKTLVVRMRVLDGPIKGEIIEERMLL